MMNEFVIEFEVKQVKHGKYGDSEKPVAEFDGTLEDGMERLREILEKKIGIINLMFA